MKAIKFYSKKKALIFISVFFTSLCLYLNTLHHDFVLDDRLVIVDNTHVQKGLDGIGDILSNSHLHGYDGTNKNTYRPISLVSFAVEKQLFGSSPVVFHLFNILSYALLCIIVTRFLFLIFPNKQTLLVLSIVALFITHPIHTEVVANIKSRDEIYAMLFGIASLISWLKYDTTKNKQYLIISLFLFLLSILSKENAITLIAIFPLTLYFFRNYDIKKALSISALFLFPLLLYFLCRTLILDDFVQSNSTTGNWKTPYNNTLFAAESYLEEVATNFMIFFKYLQLSIIPINLSSDYSIGTFEIANFSNLKSILGLLFLLGASVFSFIKIKSRSPLAYAILFFLATFSITSNFFIKIGATLGERFLFLPSLGVCIVLAFAIFRISDMTRLKEKLFLPSMILILILYSWKTIDRNQDWKNNFTLFSEDLKTNPNSARLLSNFAQEKHRKDVYIKDSEQKAIEAQSTANYYKKSLEHHPNKDFINYKLGYLYFELNKYDVAAEHFEKALPSLNVKEHEVYYQLGLCYENLNKNGEAISAFKKAVELLPESSEYWKHLGYAYFPNKQYDKAIEAFKKSIQLNGSKDSDTLYNIAVSYHAINDKTNARDYYNQVLRIDPDNSQARKNLSSINR